MASWWTYSTSLLEFGPGHEICFSQWDVSKSDASRGLKSAYVVRFAFGYSCQCHEENACQLAPLDWGEWMGQPWTQPALDQSEARSNSAPIGWCQVDCTCACDCCFKPLSLWCFISLHCAKLWLLPSAMSGCIGEEARDDIKKGQTICNTCSLPSIGRMFLSLSQAAADWWLNTAFHQWSNHLLLWTKIF